LNKVSQEKDVLSKLLKISALALVIGLLLAVQQGSAAVTLTLQSGGSPVTVFDNGPGDSNSLPGVVSFSGAVGAWIVNVSTGIAQPPLPGGLSMQDIDLNSIDIAAGSSVPLTLTLLTDPVAFPAGPIALASQIGGTLSPGMKVSAMQQVLLGTTVYATANHGTLTSSPFASTAAAYGTDTDGAFQVLSTVLLEAPASGGQTSFDLTGSVSIPEPATIIVWSLLGLSGVGIAVIRRRRTTR
jgi:hypothetical protein